MSARAFEESGSVRSRRARGTYRASRRSAGDGNCHVAFVLNPSDPKEMAEAERLNKRVVHRALSLDAPAQVSTASAAARSISCPPSTARL
jgi:hypothetical protein